MQSHAAPRGPLRATQDLPVRGALLVRIERLNGGADLRLVESKVLGAGNGGLGGGRQVFSSGSSALYLAVDSSKDLRKPARRGRRPQRLGSG